ncbi:MAG: hypothetical protein ACYTF9_05110, partial [Planctomycetota bacterium]
MPWPTFWSRAIRPNPSDHTHDPARRSWVESANDPGGDFPLQNLPLGVFRSRGALPHIGTAIGEEVLDLPIADAAGLLGRLSEKTTAALQSNSLNALMAAGQPAWHELREGIWNLLEQDAPALRDDEAARG